MKGLTHTCIYPCVQYAGFNIYTNNYTYEILYMISLLRCMGDPLILGWASRKRRLQMRIYMNKDDTHESKVYVNLPKLEEMLSMTNEIVIHEHVLYHIYLF